jgi:hypothetical protein
MVEQERYTPAASMGREEHTESKAVYKRDVEEMTI